MGLRCHYSIAENETMHFPRWSSSQKNWEVFSFQHTARLVTHSPPLSTPPLHSTYIAAVVRHTSSVGVWCFAPAWPAAEQLKHLRAPCAGFRINFRWCWVEKLKNSKTPRGRTRSHTKIPVICVFTEGYIFVNFSWIVRTPTAVKVIYRMQGPAYRQLNRRAKGHK